MKLSFIDRAKLATIQLSKQSQVTLEEAKKQAEWLKTISITKNKRKCRK
jgi:hypothetical protein